MKWDQEEVLTGIRNDIVKKIQWHFNEGLSYRKIGERLNPQMTKQAVLYYIRRYNIIKNIE